MKSRLVKRARRVPLLVPAATAVERVGVRATYHLHDRILANTASRRRLRDHPPQLDVLQTRIVDELRATGLAALGLEELCSASLLDRLAAHARPFVESVEAVPASPFPEESAGTRRKKDYVTRLYERGSPLALEDPWLALGSSQRVLDVVNAYLELWSKLVYVDVWYTKPGSAEGERIKSQRWHRDYNDRHLVKVFLYLSDVDEGAGPFEYVRGSAREGELAGEWPWRPLGETYPPPDEFAQRIPEVATVTLTGKAGTLIFCNTSGFHRGGFATERPRVMGVLNYVSPASLESLCDRNFRIDPAGLPADLGAQRRYALT